MKFFEVSNKDRKFNYNETSIELNDFVNKQIFSGVSKIDNKIYITEKLLEDILNGNDHIEGINLDWTSATELIKAHLNEKLISEKGIKILQESDFEFPETVTAIKIKLPGDTFDKYSFIEKNEDSEKLIYTFVEDFPKWSTGNYD